MCTVIKHQKIRCIKQTPWRDTPVDNLTTTKPDENVPVFGKVYEISEVYEMSDELKERLGKKSNLCFDIKGLSVNSSYTPDNFEDVC